MKETISLEKNLANELKRKEAYIEELVNKQVLLEQQLQEGLDIFCILITFNKHMYANNNERKKPTRVQEAMSRTFKVKVYMNINRYIIPKIALHHHA